MLPTNYIVISGVAAIVLFWVYQKPSTTQTTQTTQTTTTTQTTQTTQNNTKNAYTQVQIDIADFIVVDYCPRV